MNLFQEIADAKILIIDNEIANVRLLEMMLTDEGYRNLRPLLDPTRILEVFDEFLPDILLLDLHMPHLDGFEVMELLRPRIAADEFLPILVLTADIATAVKRKALTAGASDFVTKPFDTDEVLLRVKNLLRTRAAHIRVKSQNAVLEAKVRERTWELSETCVLLGASQIETLERLAIAGEYRDDDTGHHTRRVGDIAARLATALGLPPDRAELFRRAAPLHDLGKIGIPDSILLKPGKLTPEEFEVLKGHTAIGAAILSGSQSPLLQLAEEIALSHHERWDGTGYPYGLAGESIPLAGRIVTICDVFDALTHERPYKEAWPIEEAIKEIQRQHGKQFDPAIADAFLSLHECSMNV